MKKPPLPNLSSQEGENLIKRLESSRRLRPEDLSLLSSVIRSYTYLQWAIKEAKIGWNKLCRYFGLTPRPRANGRQRDNQLDELLAASDNQNDSDSVADDRPAASANSKNPQDEPKQKKKNKGHGRNSHEDFTQAEEIHYTHQTLKAGDACPDHCGGCIHSFKPGMFLELQCHFVWASTLIKIDPLFLKISDPLNAHVLEGNHHLLIRPKTRR